MIQCTRVKPEACGPGPAHNIIFVGHQALDEVLCASTQTFPIQSMQPGVIVFIQPIEGSRSAEVALGENELETPVSSRNHF